MKQIDIIRKEVKKRGFKGVVKSLRMRNANVVNHDSLTRYEILIETHEPIEVIDEFDARCQLDDLVNAL